MSLWAIGSVRSFSFIHCALLIFICRCAGDGLLTSLEESIVSPDPITICLNVSAPSEVGGFAIAYLGLVEANEEFTTFTILSDTYLPTTPSICIKVQQGKKNYFPVGSDRLLFCIDFHFSRLLTNLLPSSLVNNYDSKQYVELWTPEEFGMLIVAIIVYGLLLLADLFAFGLYELAIGVDSILQS